MSEYTRNINVQVDILNSDLMKAVAIMENKVEGSPKSAYFKVEVIVTVNNFEIKSVENVIIDAIFPVCCEVVPKLNDIIGITISKGYNKKIMELVGGENGCTHMVELLIEIGRCIYQAHHGHIFKKDGANKSIEEYKTRSNVQCLGLNKHG